MERLNVVVLIAFIFGCKSNNLDIPQIISSYQQSDLFGEGIQIGKTNNTLLREVYDKRTLVAEIMPGELIDQKYPLEYRLFHLSRDTVAELLAINNKTNQLEKYTYNPKALKVESVYVHSSDAGKNGLVVTLIDQEAIKDSSKVLVHSLEILRTGKFQIEGIYESFEGTVKFRNEENLYSGSYTALEKNIKVDLLLKDGLSARKYYGLMKIRTPENCMLTYQFSDKDLSGKVYEFDEFSELLLTIENGEIMITNSKYDLCNEPDTRFNLTLSKMD